MFDNIFYFYNNFKQIDTLLSFSNWILINGTIYPFLIISKYFINYLKSFNFKYKGIFVLLIIFNIFYYNLSFLLIMIIQIN